jgi:hypothetical protein
MWHRCVILLKTPDFVGKADSGYWDASVKKVSVRGKAGDRPQKLINQAVFPWMRGTGSGGVGGRTVAILKLADGGMERCEK